MSKELKDKFHEAMLGIYRKASSECKYHPTRFLQLVNDIGGYSAAKQLLYSEEYSEGLTKLWELGRLDISMEALVLEKKWRGLFTPEELAVAKKRLDDLHYYDYDK